MSIPTELDDVEVTGEISLATPPGMGTYRTFTMPLHVDPEDQVHLISSYNEQWDREAGVITKDVAGKASFHFSTESDWLDHIELNFDHTLADDTVMRRVFGMAINTVTGLAYHVFVTDPTAGVQQRLEIGGEEASVARWVGGQGTAAVRFVTRNENAGGHAVVMVQNADGRTGHLQMGPATTPGTLFGLPAEDLFCVYGDTPTVMGTAGAHPLYFATDTTVRGGIDEAGTWYQRRDGVDHPIPHDAVSWSVLRPWKSGEYYQTQPGAQRVAAALKANTAYAAELIVPRAATFDSIAVEVTTPAAGSTLRLGVYADDGGGAPGALVADFGTVDAGTAGSRALSISQVLQPGLYWVVVAALGGAPSIRTLSGAGSGMVPQPLTGTAVCNGYVGAHPTDALAATWTPAAVPTTARAPLVLVRVA